MISKEDLFYKIGSLEQELIELGAFLHANPELGNEEFQAVDRITTILQNNGFLVEKGLASLETAFRATYTVGTGGPVIGLLCEYDALQDLGHGCGHNLQSPSVLGAAIALSQLEDLPACTIEVLGTPAEETTSGKIPMAQQGYFDHLDIALMMHGGDRTTVDGRSLAVDNFEFVFEGKASHAAVAPEKGISALDGVLMTFNGMEYLREHVRSDVRIHGIITDGGIAANIVPERAAAKFSIRAINRPYLDTVVERALNVARGAALATGTKVHINPIKSLESKLNVQALNDLLLNNAELVKAKNITPPREQTGSTDFSIVTHRVPGACIRVAFVPQGTPNHTKEWVKASNSKEGNEAIMTAAKTMGATCIDVLSSPELLKEIKAQFSAEKEVQNNLVLQ
ncbi:M20 family metallopeptidase [Sporosarcina sp. Sa2YVA2]|uniref:Peptidase M20 domain-containing protein 2 n=1 Tax=Sporosarcina quadrami TaxID=2762234 RepID=A0ABR8U9V8_9BACL|nr:M20 family metallopeptidase [Sporosarcina quadrami]MBD7984514.1 M20 family metallopeptidase [Sporosarcina quadrami]